MRLAAAAPPCFPSAVPRANAATKSKSFDFSQDFGQLRPSAFAALCADDDDDDSSDDDDCPALVPTAIMDDLDDAAAAGLFRVVPPPDPLRLCPPSHSTWVTGQRRHWPDGSPRETTGPYGPRRQVVHHRFQAWAARLRVRSRARHDTTRRDRAYGRWVQLMGTLVLARAYGSVPSNATGTGPAEPYLHLHCNGHANQWAAVTCSCVSVRDHLVEQGMAVPGFLTQAGPVAEQCAHDSANCAQAGKWAPTCADDACLHDSIAGLQLHGDSGSAPAPAPAPPPDPWVASGAARGAARAELRAALRPSAQSDSPREHTWRWWRARSRLRGRLRHGIRLPWTSPPKPFVKPNNPNYVSADVEGTYTEMARLRRRGFLEGPFSRDEIDPTPPSDEPVRQAVIVCQPLAAVPKKNTTRIRLVVDFTASGSNACLPPRAVSLPTCEDAVRNVAQCNMWGAKLDLADAFFMNALHPTERAHHVVYDPTPAGWRPPPGSEEYGLGDAGVHEYAASGPQAERRYWRYKVTPFGSKLSPYYLAVMVDDLMEHLRSTWGLRLLGYVDDMLVSGRSVRAVRTHVGLLRSCLQFLGLGESVKKFEDADVQWNWLGLEIDTREAAMEVRYPADKKAKLLSEMADFERRYRAPGARAPRAQLASLVGRLSFASNGVHHGKLYLRRLYDGLHHGNSSLTLHQRVHCLGTTALTAEFWADWDWWSHILPICRGRRFWIDRNTDFHHVFGDASKHGRGATWYTSPRPRAFAAAFDEDMQAASSNLRELSTIWSAIVCWGHHWKPGCRVLYTTDNRTTAACINRACTASPQLMALTRQIHGWGAEHGVEFLSRWVSGVALIKEGSDGLSREDRFEPTVRTEWALTAPVAAHWQRVHGSVPVMPVFDDVGATLKAALLAHETDPSTGHTFVVPEWHTASWFGKLKSFRLDFAYPAGTAILRHPSHPTQVCSTRHPLVVIRLPTPGEAPLSRTQRRQGQACTARPS